MIYAKKLLTTLIVGCVIALLVVSVPTVSACGEARRDAGVLVSQVDMAYSPDWGYWRGTITGALHGTIGFWEGPALIQDGIDYFSESFVITTTKGVIRGTDEGVYNLTTGAFWAYGQVTTATGHWRPLVGYTAFEWGTTSEPFVFPMIANDMPFVLLPAHPAPTHDDDVLVSHTDMAYSPDWGYWRGTMKGDIRGTVGFWEQPQNYAFADREYFFEAFTITTRTGVIQGVDLGFYNLTTGDFWAHGQVTQASGAWHFLVGYTVFEWGTTSKPLVFPMIGHHVPFVLVDM